MNPRPQFLINGPSRPCAWLLPLDIASQIEQAAREHEKPFLIEAGTPDVTIYANDDASGSTSPLEVGSKQLRNPAHVMADARAQGVEYLSMSKALVSGPEQPLVSSRGILS